MRLEPKVVLQLPISDRALLSAFVEDCLANNVSLIAIVGEGCAEIENDIDELIVSDGSDETRFITTSTHPGDTLEDVIEFASAWWINADGPTNVVRL